MSLINLEDTIAALEKRERLMIPDQDGKKYLSTDAMKTFLLNRPTVEASPMISAKEKVTEEWEIGN